MTELTIRPEANFHPILSLNQTTEPDAALLRVHDGQLHGIAQLPNTQLFPLALLVVALAAAQTPILPGRTPLLDAHNCYPYFEWWRDRIDRALSVGTPLGEQEA